MLSAGLLLVVFSCFLGIQNVFVFTESFMQVYRPVRVSPSGLPATALFESETDSFTKCAFRANVRGTCYLACYVDGVCKLYEKLISAGHQDASPDAIDCYTKLYDECVVGSNVIKDQGTIFMMPNCVHFICVNKTTQSKYEAVTQACPTDFIAMPGLGCLYYVENDNDTANFSDAKSHCDSISSQLMVLDDFDILKTHLGCRQWHLDVLGDYWIDVYNGSWSNNEEVSLADWGPGFPDPMGDPCGYAKSDVYFAIANGNCSDLKNYICKFV